MTELICFDCLTDPNAVPGPDAKKAAVTIHEGTALCEPHTRDRVRAKPQVW